MSDSRRFRLLVFDWDGTLADSASTIARAIQRACDDLGQPVPSEQDARYVIGLGMAEAVRHVAPGLAPADYARLADRYRIHYLTQDSEIPLFEGAAQLLAELDARGFLLAVATGKSRRGLDRALAQFGLATRFAATRCADEGLPKPHPDMLLHLMGRFGSAPSETLMIGDTTHDLELARNAGVEAVAAGFGAHPPETLAVHRPLAAVASFSGLAKWLLALAAPKW